MSLSTLVAPGILRSSKRRQILFRDISLSLFDSWCAKYCRMYVLVWYRISLGDLNITPLGLSILMSILETAFYFFNNYLIMWSSVYTANGLQYAHLYYKHWGRTFSLTAWKTVLLEKLIIAQLFENCTSYVEQKTYYQFATSYRLPYVKPNKSSPRHFTQF